MCQSKKFRTKVPIAEKIAFGHAKKHDFNIRLSSNKTQTRTSSRSKPQKHYKSTRLRSKKYNQTTYRTAEQIRRRRVKKKKFQNRTRLSDDSQYVFISNNPTLLPSKCNVSKSDNLENRKNSPGFIMWPSGKYGFDPRYSWNLDGEHHSKFRSPSTFDLYIETPLKEFKPPSANPNSEFLIVKANNDDILLLKCFCKECVRSTSTRKQQKEIKKATVTKQARGNQTFVHSRNQNRKKTLESKSERSNISLTHRYFYILIKINALIRNEKIF